MNSNGFKEKVTPLQEVVATVPEKKVKLKIEKNRIRSGLYIAGGIQSLALAIIGIAVPGLPVTHLHGCDRHGGGFVFRTHSPR